jgi:tripartite-type tricarboxylate transporter receptor subunit TctC
LGQKWKGSNRAFHVRFSPDSGGRADIPDRPLAIPSAQTAVESGRLRPIAVTSAQRLPGYEGVPTVAETFPGFNFTGWMMLVAPARIPSDVVARLNREMQPIMSDPEIVKQLRDIGFFTGGAGTPESTAAFVKSQYEAWGRVVQEIGIRPE